MCNVTFVRPGLHSWAKNGPKWTIFWVPGLCARHISGTGGPIYTKSSSLHSSWPIDVQCHLCWARNSFMGHPRAKNGPKLTIFWVPRLCAHHISGTGGLIHTKSSSLHSCRPVDVQRHLCWARATFMGHLRATN